MGTFAAGRVGAGKRDGTDQPRPSGAALAKRLPHQLFEALPLNRRRQTMDFLGWINTVLRTMDRESVVAATCERFLETGVPLDRYSSSTTVLTADHDALGRVWVRGKGVRETVYVRPAAEDPDYLNSPLYEADRTKDWVELWLPETPDTRFGIVKELKDDGYVHYLCIPLTLRNDAQGWITMATRSSAGFSAEDLTIVALTVPTLATLIDGRVSAINLDRLLRTYVGDEPHRAILAGNVKRGQVTTIRSAILFADMRDSTGHTAELSAVQAVALFNDFFDNLVPPIESRGGEVLKYVGDGLLAIFRESKSQSEGAANRALAAAEAILVNIASYNAAHPGQRKVELGIALHYGEVAYGNVGSGVRLDFTVIGRDVGLTSRIGGMNARLGEPLLLSEAFAARLDRAMVALGAFAARGFTAPIAVYRPPHSENQAG